MNAKPNPADPQVLGPLTDDGPAFLTPRQFGLKTQLSESTVKRWCDDGQIACIVISERGDRRIPASEVDRLLVEAQASRTKAHG